jgi:hypothetical protein
MGAFMNTEYSNEQLTREDLIRLKNIVLGSLRTRVYQAKLARRYAGRLMMLALCQGAAQNYLYGAHGKNGRGVKDLDVWAFHYDGLEKPFPPRTHWRTDFGESHLGCNPHDDGYVGRRIDIVGRSIPFVGNAKDSFLTWLKGDSDSASLLMKKPVIGLFPENYLGAVIWPGIEIDDFSIRPENAAAEIAYLDERIGKSLRRLDLLNGVEPLEMRALEVERLVPARAFVSRAETLRSRPVLKVLPGRPDRV